MNNFFKKKEASAAIETEASRKNHQVRIAKAAYHRILINKAAGLLGWALLSVFIVYICFAGTILRIVTNPYTGPVLVKEITYPGGLIPAGEKITINTNLDLELSQGFFEKIAQGVLPQAESATVFVFAGPYGTVTTMSPGSSKGVVINGDFTQPNLTVTTLAGKTVPIFLPEDFKESKLKDQYFGVCIAGSCRPGEGIIFSSKNVYGTLVSGKGNK